MIIGEKREEVIENIKIAIDEENLNKKVEIGDPELSVEQQKEITDNYIKNRKKVLFKIKTIAARFIVKSATTVLNKNIQIVGLENIKDIKTGAIITSNHFNQLDTIIIQKLVKKVGKKRLYIVSQATNLAMPGLIGFLMNYADIIPITKQPNYLMKDFPEIIREKLEKKNYILIYPEEEMWFNYKKPRNFKPGAYYFAAKYNVPIISCFTEMVETEEEDNDQFNKVKYVLHVLPPIYPDKNKSEKENIVFMLKKDYIQKKSAYENAYGKELNKEFEIEDIAGWRYKNGL